MTGHDEDFQRLLHNAKVVQPVQPRTVTEITLQSNQLAMVKLTNDEGEVVGYELKFADPFWNRIITFPMSVQNALDFFADLQDLLIGKTDE